MARADSDDGVFQLGECAPCARAMLAWPVPDQLASTARRLIAASRPGASKTTVLATARGKNAGESGKSARASMSRTFLRLRASSYRW